MEADCKLIEEVQDEGRVFIEYSASCLMAVEVKRNVFNNNVPYACRLMILETIRCVQPRGVTLRNLEYQREGRTERT